MKNAKKLFNFCLTFRPRAEWDLKKVKETILENDLDKKVYQEVLDIKSNLFPALTLNLLIVGTAFVLGGGVQTKVLSKYWHLGIFYLGLFHYLKVI